MSFTMPPTGFGPGSQPGPEDGVELNYMAMPSGMRTFEARLPDIDDPAAARPMLDFLLRLAKAAEAAASGHRSAMFDVASLNPFNRALLAETLHEGEVSVVVEGQRPAKIQEAVFAGLWLTRQDSSETVEVGAVPLALHDRAHEPVAAAQGLSTPHEDGVMSAPALVAELIDKAVAHQAGMPAHVINLTLLPHTPQDLVHLDEALGRGAASALSRGYGDCRVSATAVPRLWRVQYFNSVDALILDTFEVAELPSAAIAVAEDLLDSAERLTDTLEAIA